MRYAVRRILSTVPMLLVLTVVVFSIIHLIPGDPVAVMLGVGAEREAVEAERARLGLDKPLVEQYFIFMKNLLHGDLGTSIVTRQPVTAELARRFPATLTLAFWGTLIAAILGIALGVVAAVRHNKLADNLIILTSLLSVSTPSFFLAIILMIVFTVQLRWLPSILLPGQSPFLYMIMPVMTLATQATGVIARTTRSSMLDVLGQDYIRTSRSRGIRESVITYSHALKNALIPVLTVIGLRFGYLLSGATIVETVFSIAGVGRFMVEGVLKRDYPVVQGTVLIMAASFVLVNTAVDLLYSAVDPRIRYE